MTYYLYTRFKTATGGACYLLLGTRTFTNEWDANKVAKEMETDGKKRLGADYRVIVRGYSDTEAPPTSIKELPPGWEYHNGAICDEKVSRERREDWYRECQESARLNGVR